MNAPARQVSLVLMLLFLGGCNGGATFVGGDATPPPSPAMDGGGDAPKEGGNPSDAPSESASDAPKEVASPPPDATPDVEVDATVDGLAVDGGDQ